MSEAATTVSITINGVDHDVATGTLLISAAEGIGEYIPRFCHHDKLEPVGKCRMCLVEVEGPRGRQLVPSCTMTVSNGTRYHRPHDPGGPAKAHQIPQNTK